MKTQSNSTSFGPVYVEIVDYPAGAGKYGSGGWGRSAKHRPQPQCIGFVCDEVQISGQTVRFSAGIQHPTAVNLLSSQNRRKVNLFDLRKKTWIRTDYPDVMDREARFKFLPDAEAPKPIPPSYSEIQSAKRTAGFKEPKPPTVAVIAKYEAAVEAAKSQDRELAKWHGLPFRERKHGEPRPNYRAAKEAACGPCPLPLAVPADPREAYTKKMAARAYAKALLEGQK